MSAARAYRFSEFCAWGLVGSCAALALVGVLGMFTEDVFGLAPTDAAITALAFVMAFAILQINNMSEAAMQAIDRPFAAWHWPTLVPAAFCVVVFAVASNIGVHLGWEVLAASAAHPERLPGAGDVGAIFFVLSIAKPLSMLAVAGRKAMDAAKAQAAEDAALARQDRAQAADRANRHAEALARIEAEAAASQALPRAKGAANDAGPPTGGQTAAARAKPRKPLHLVEKAGAAAMLGAALIGGAGQAAAAPSPPHDSAVSASAGAVSPADRAHARALIAAGATAKAAHRASGVPYSTCKAYKQQLQGRAA